MTVSTSPRVSPFAQLLVCNVDALTGLGWLASWTFIGEDPVCCWKREQTKHPRASSFTSTVDKDGLEVGNPGFLAAMENDRLIPSRAL
ncbi:hypothetical protein PG995_005245 [Apiospora arundinis]